MDGWNTSLGWPIFRCYVSFRESAWGLHPITTETHPPRSPSENGSMEPKYYAIRRDWTPFPDNIHRISTYIYKKNQPNVGKYASPMDPMGYHKVPRVGLQLFVPGFF